MVQLYSSKVQYRSHQAKIKVSVGLCPFLEAYVGENLILCLFQLPAASHNPWFMASCLLIF